jgi:pimeloyl-ACP methyl ester carboxylesterase
MAGASAIAYAAAQPPELEKLVLVDVAGLVEPELRRPPAELAQAYSAVDWARHCAARWVHEAGPVRDLVEALGLEHASRLPQALEKTLEANRKLRQAPPPMELEKIAVPTLVLAGRHSTVMGPQAAQRVAQRLQRGSVLLFEHSAHALALEEPERFQDVIAQFVLG